MTYRLMAGLLAGVVLTCGSLMAQSPGVGPDRAAREGVVRKAGDFLRNSQDARGGWSTDKTPGVTGICLTGLLRSGAATPNDPVARKALGYIESLVNPDKRHIAGKDPKIQLQNYVTSVNVMALVNAHQSDKYRAIVGDAVEFLKKLQWDEDEGKSESDDFYGGAGYDSKSRPDLSN